MRQHLTRDELIEIVRKLQQCEGTEQEQNELLALLDANVPYPAVSDLIYGWGFDVVESELTPEEVVDIALAYKQIITPSSRTLE